jgi:hypothetical protein
MSDILNGNRVNLPDWRFVAFFVEACHAAATESNLDTHDLGSPADWKGHWDSANNGVIDARFPSGGQPLSTVPDPGTSAGAKSPKQGDEPPTIDDGRAPVLWGSVPPRLTDFVGRETWLADLRGLVAGSQANPVVIQGLCGIGKTQLAVEYAYRYASAYELVWWLSCDDAASAYRAMAELRARLGLPDAAPEADDEGHRRYEEAFQFQQDTLDLMRSTPGDWDHEITLLGALPGARRRVLGRFAEALAADLESREKYVARFGRDHPHSFAAATAVILDLALTGQFADAVREARQVYEDCRAFHNDDSYPAVLFQRNMLARLTDLAGDDHPLTLAARSALASVLDDDGEFFGTDFTPLPL